jgi:hypothetical protein
MPCWRLLGLLVLFGLAGCGSADPVLTPVSGTITVGEQPLAGAFVRFIPQGSTPGHGGAGRTDEQGKYEVIAHRSKNRKGLVPGEYKVVVTRMLMPDGSPLPPDTPPIDSGARESVPEPYCKLQRTPLTLTVGNEAVTYDCPLQK